MSLLTICKSVLAEVGWPVVSSIVSNQDATAQQIFAIANAELEAISELFDWPHLEVEYPFVTVPGQAVVLWPSDFRNLSHSSVFNKDEYYEIKGSTSMQYWELLKYGKLSSLNRARYRTTYPLGVPGIEITPAPTDAENLVSVYYSGAYARDQDGNSIPRFMTDTDVSKVPERYVKLGVKWRFRRAKGLDFSAELAEYNSTVQTQFSKYVGAAEINVGGRRLWPYDGYCAPGYVREDRFGV